MYFSKNPKSLMTNDLRDLHDHLPSSKEKRKLFYIRNHFLYNRSHMWDVFF